ncbi:MAG: TerB family tellurite resistance protein [Bacteroidota bacterium]|nr:TerB family tellurite resistance protein [Bacteroidota bacterium]
MAKYGKWLGGGLGFVLGGPIGALLGFAVGSFFDSSSVSVTKYQTARGNFAASLIVLVAAVMKADNKVTKSELEYVKKFFTQTFGYEKAADAVLMLRDILKKDIPVEDVCAQIQRNMKYPERLQLIHFLFGVANADNQIAKNELFLIRKISTLLRIDERDFESIKSMFVKDTESAYKILEVDPNASASEIKKAYRKMAVKYHPDKVSHLGDDFQNFAKEKFQKVNQAYETLKNEKQFT